jgi:hypothetical protein
VPVVVVLLVLEGQAEQVHLPTLAAAVAVVAAVVRQLRPVQVEMVARELRHLEVQADLQVRLLVAQEQEDRPQQEQGPSDLAAVAR